MNPTPAVPAEMITWVVGSSHVFDCLCVLLLEVGAIERRAGGHRDGEDVCGGLGN